MHQHVFPWSIFNYFIKKYREIIKEKKNYLKKNDMEDEVAQQERSNIKYYASTFRYNIEYIDMSEQFVHSLSI